MPFDELADNGLRPFGRHWTRAAATDQDIGRGNYRFDGPDWRADDECVEQILADARAADRRVRRMLYRGELTGIDLKAAGLTDLEVEEILEDAMARCWECDRITNDDELQDFEDRRLCGDCLPEALARERSGRANPAPRGGGGGGLNKIGPTDPPGSPSKPQHSIKPKRKRNRIKLPRRKS